MNYLWKRLFYLIYFPCLIFIVWLLPGKVELEASINIVPFKTIRLYVAAFVHGYAPLYVIMSNLIGNIILLFPIGILLYHHLRHLGLAVILFFSLYIPTYIETGQFLLYLSGYGARSVDIDDVLLNMLGIWTGFLLARYGGKLKTAKRKK